MAHSKVAALLAAFALLAWGCDGRRAIQGSVTVKLPPARPAAATPAFSFKAPQKLRSE